MAHIVLLVIAAYAVARVGRFIALDKLAEPFRMWVTRHRPKGSKITYLVFCHWCVGIWTAAVAAPIIWFAMDYAAWFDLTSWLGVPLLWLALAMAASNLIKD